MELTKKIYSTVIKQEGPADSRDLTFVISDESEDRDGDIIEVQGWQTAEFMSNPVMLCFHEYDKLPIARFTSINKDLRSMPHRLLAVAHFPAINELCPTGEVSEHAKNVDTIFNMYKLGVLNAVSVGCQYLKAEPRQDYPVEVPDYARGKRVTQASLLEVSAVPIPANAHALVQLESAHGMEKGVVEFVTKAFKESEKPACIEHENDHETGIEPKEVKPIEQKTGRRLSADSLSKLDDIEAKLADFDKIMTSIDDVQKTLSSARDDMVQLIHSLRDGEATEEPEPEVEEGQDGAKSVKDTVIKIVG